VFINIWRESGYKTSVSTSPSHIAPPATFVFLLEPSAARFDQLPRLPTSAPEMGASENKSRKKWQGDISTIKVVLSVDWEGSLS
jgi:hypothetical protein